MSTTQEKSKNILFVFPKIFLRGRTCRSQILQAIEQKLSSSGNFASSCGPCYFFRKLIHLLLLYAEMNYNQNWLRALTQTFVGSRLRHTCIYYIDLWNDIIFEQNIDYITFTTHSSVVLRLSVYVHTWTCACVRGLGHGKLTYFSF